MTRESGGGNLLARMNRGNSEPVAGNEPHRATLPACTCLAQVEYCDSGEWCWYSFLARINCGNSEPVAGNELHCPHYHR